VKSLMKFLFIFGSQYSVVFAGQRIEFKPGALCGILRDN
jgi:hypothetical protein